MWCPPGQVVNARKATWRSVISLAGALTWDVNLIADDVEFWLARWLLSAPALDLFGRTNGRRSGMRFLVDDDLFPTKRGEFYCWNSTMNSQDLNKNGFI